MNGAANHRPKASDEGDEDEGQETADGPPWWRLRRLPVVMTGANSWQTLLGTSSIGGRRRREHVIDAAALSAWVLEARELLRAAEARLGDQHQGKSLPTA